MVVPNLIESAFQQGHMSTLLFQNWVGCGYPRLCTKKDVQKNCWKYI